MQNQSGDFDSWREAFLTAIQESESAEILKAAALASDLKSWTARMTAAVVRSCEALGWRAAGKGHQLSLLPQIGQEYLGIDAMAFDGAASIRWPLPVAAFELENHAQDNRVAYSLWKVLCLRVGLRVVFAYRLDWERSRQLVNAVVTDVVHGLRPDQRTAIDGQTVLVVGNRGEGETFPWGYFKFWMLDANLGRFEKV
jgi:hypothetical protein